MTDCHLTPPKKTPLLIGALGEVRYGSTRAHLLPLTKKLRCFFEKATAPTAPIWPVPTPMHFLVSASHNLTCNRTQYPRNDKKRSGFKNERRHQPSGQADTV